jgi:hypothetical protein
MTAQDWMWAAGCIFMVALIALLWLERGGAPLPGIDALRRRKD